MTSRFSLTPPAGTYLLGLVSVCLISACGTMAGTAGGPTMGEQSSVTYSQEIARNGTLTGIAAVPLEGDHQLGIGAVLGAAAGGLLGHQIGSGSGQDVATVLGAIGGGVAGNVMQRKYTDKRPGQTLTVRLENGVSVLVTQEADASWRIGEAVRIEGVGAQARVRRR